MKKVILLAVLAVAVLAAWCSCTSRANAGNAADVEQTDSLPVVYYIKDINPENLLKIYRALGRNVDGNNVAVKISTGESGKSNHLSPALIAPFVNEVKGTIVECNTAYGGNRSTTADHLKAAEEHGYTAIAKVDIMDADGDTAIVVDGGLRLDKNLVGRHLADYDFLVVLSHFKGHAMGGFGGALKNVAIGIASADGKAYVHSAGKVSDPAVLWDNIAEQTAFLESMADACKSVFDMYGDKKLFINVANRLSVDCDCNGNPDAPEMGDIGILASLDPVALDRACVDMVVNSDDPGKAALIERINSRQGTHILDAAEKLGIGSQKYTLVTLE
ncbi:DUF362 domain-containing protein [Muribaculum sp.]|uniref:DUF362 domain-containing protein n=1 Tax=Muribaculum sp. TaxID=1918611 RepID=UPI0023C99779|nr:DUF362 domain-containing protein [Muribaculum sp.]MDE5705366.1 DUF362 domain-containing protein [Muribaculum sp.]